MRINFARFFSIIFLIVYITSLFAPLQAVRAAPAPAPREALSTSVDRTLNPVSSLPEPASDSLTDSAPGPEPAPGGYEVLSQEQFVPDMLWGSDKFPIGVNVPLDYIDPSYSVSRNSNGLTITPITAYNLIVDSNVLSPSSYGPSTASLGAEFCNTTGSTMTNVWAYVGNYDKDMDGILDEANDTDPGVYPIHNDTTHLLFEATTFDTRFPHLATSPTAVDYGDPSRFYALEQEAGSLSDSVDASRYIGTLAAGECKVQYWLASYPRKAYISGGWVDVTGGVKPEDDLWLWYHFWATSNATVTPSYYWRPATMRNEISAMANKIWPNGDNKVPDQYLQAIQDVLGWDTITPSGTGNAYPGETVTSQGIWYDFGVVGAGFDNNGDLVPDRNAWVQPIGDASGYDPGCFRLVMTYGLVIVKLNDGTELLIPFVDQLYFENIPDNNTGAVGLVYYQYLALDGACTANLTPYQEVASGYDNEKFNGDFGAGIPPLQSQETNMTLDKSGNASVTSGSNINYTMTFTLPQDNDAGFSFTVGNLDVNMPLVFQETVPSGTTYVAGTALFDTGFNPAITGTVYYSHDGGATWSTTEAPAGTVTHIQWWLDSEVVSQDSSSVQGRVAFSVNVPVTYTPSIVNDTGCLKLGHANCFTEDTHSTLVSGLNSLSGNAWADTGAGGGVTANAIKDGTEPNLPNVKVDLYFDSNGDSTGDVLYGTTNSDASGNYFFTSLADGYWVVVVDKYDGDIPTGYAPTTLVQHATALDPTRVVGTPVTQSGLDFGFAPVLSLDKNLSNIGTVYVNDTATYVINMVNNLPGDGEGGSGACTYKVWSSVANPTTGVTPPGGGPVNAQWQSTSFALGRPDQQYAFSNLANADDLLGLSGLNIGNVGGSITSVQFVYYMSERVNLKGTDEFNVRVFYSDAQIGSDYTYFGSSTFTGPVGTDYVVSQDITGLRSWTLSDFTSNRTELQVEGNKGSGFGDSGDFDLDAIGFIITTNQTCGGDSSTILNPVPLTDTYDATKLLFVSSDPPVTSNSAGTLTWNNVGPLYPGQIKPVTVTFKALATVVNSVNTATSTNAKFADGRSANSPVSDTAQVTITASSATGSIAGVVWDDDDNDGWQGGAGGTGHDVTDSRISDVKVSLYACKTDAGALVTDTGTMTTCQAAGGIWVLMGVAYTASDGTYSFTNLNSGFYRVVVDQTTVAGNTGQTGDPNETTGICSTCDHQANAADDADIDGAGFIGQINGSNAITNVNFGYRAPDVVNSIIGDTLYYDWDGDGSQDANEEGMSNITVNLYDLSGDLIETQVTNTSGLYCFAGTISGGVCTQDGTGLSAGVYSVRVDQADAQFPSASVSETADPDESGACTICDSVGYSTVTGSDVDLIVDFGYQPQGLGTIGDTVWRDMNGDASQSGVLETGISGVAVLLQVDLNGDGTYVTLATDTTDSNGNYLFEDLAVGATYNYRVVIDMGNAANQTAVPNDAFGVDYFNTTGTKSASLIYRNVSITSVSPNDLTADFGFSPPATIGDTVYQDINNNGSQDFNEPGISGVTATLYTFTDSNGSGRYEVSESGTLVATGQTDVTDSDGVYQFTGLTPGYYLVQITPPAGATLTGDPSTDGFSCLVLNDPADAGEPSSTVCDHRDGMRLYNGSNYMGADFGYQLPGSFGDTLWIDTNNNNILDIGETGIPDITVTAVTANNVTVNGTNFPAGTTLTTTTDANGNYFFQNIVPVGGSATWTVTVDTADLDFPVGLSNSSDPDDPDGDNSPAHNSATAVVINTSGVVLSVGALLDANDDGDTSDDLYLDADFGYRFAGPTDLSGTICLESVIDGVCGTSTSDPSGVGTGESAYDNIVVYLYKLNDTNSNGQLDSGETTVLVATTSTNTSGDYAFNDIADGVYYIIAIGAPQDGLVLTSTETSVNTGGDGTETTDYVETSAIDGDTLSAYQVVQVTSGDTSVVDRDFAFELNGNYDFGDLPASYATLLDGTPDGARALVPASPTLYLGSVAPDFEANGSPSTGATSDDATGDDEDGATATGTWVNGDNGGTVQIVVNGSGYLAGWIDLNEDGDFNDGNDDGDGNFNEPGEWREFIIGQNVTSGTYNPTVDIPAGTFGSGDTILNSRFRLFPSAPPIPALSYSGVSSSGEVEDYSYTWSMTIDKDTSTATASPTGTVTYTVTIKNTGNQTLTNIQAADTLPDFNGGSAGTGYNTPVTVTADSGLTVNGNYDGLTDANLLAGTDSLAAGVSKLITISFTLDNAPAGTYDNTVSASSSDIGTIDDDGLAANDPGTPTSPTTDPETDEDVTVSSNASIGNYVWNDVDGDGVQDGGESGINGVMVELFNSSNVSQGTTTTAGGGMYSFSGIVPGDYYVQFTLPAGYVFTTQDAAAATDATDSDANTTTGRTATTTLSAGETDNTWDAGMYQLATIGDFVWNDLDGDGIQDGGLEVGISGVTVFVDIDGSGTLNAGDLSDTTDGTGTYSITNIPPGIYNVRVDNPPAGYSLTTANDPTNTTLTVGEIDNTFDFGYQQTATIGNYVWNDLDGDGVQDGGLEVGLDGVRVYIDSDNDNSYDAGEPTATTAGGGLYSIGNLAAGTYNVRVDTTTLPAGYRQTYDLNGGLDHEASVTVTAGQIRTDVDFGYQQQNAVISDFVWNDVNGDGLQAGESGIDNVRVYIDSDNDNSYDAGEPTSTTAGGGLYSIGNLAAGTYNVRVDTTTLPAGYGQTYDLNGGLDHEASVTVTAGQTRTDVDFGYQQQNAVISDFVWNDLDGDGVQDGGLEVGLDGIRVYIDSDNNNSYDAGEPTSTTAGGGLYSIGGLAAGTYNVRVDTTTLPAGYGQTYDLNGGLDHEASVTLTAGQTHTDVDFGYQQQNAVISDFVWNDLDGDGVQDGGLEVGLDGVRVYIDSDNDNSYDAGEPASTTAGGGLYSIGGLAAGTYNVRVDTTTLPAGYGQTYDLNGGLDHEASVTLTAGQIRTDVDFGYQQQNAVISDFVWNDVNGDGLQAGESGIDNVRVYIDSDNDNSYDAGEPTSTTAGGGLYSIGGLAAGTYNVRVDTTTLPAGYGQTYDLNGGLDHEASVTVTAGQTRTDVDFGYQQTAMIGNYVWNDIDGDGVQDGGESGINGVTVELFNSSNVSQGTTTTAGGGMYSFSGIAPGDYYVQFTLPAGYVFTTQDAAAATDATDSDANTTTGRTATTTLNAGETDNTWDTGMYQLVTISGSVYDDSTGSSNDAFDANDDPIQNVTVGLYLDAGSGVPGAQVGSNVTTLADGSYTFTNVPPGNYVVVETDPSGYNSVTDIDGDTTSPAYNRIPLTVTNANSTDNDFLDELNSAIQIVKTPGLTVVNSSGSVTYSYVVTNPGAVSLTSVVVTDDKCSPVNYVSGDTNSNNTLETTETWNYNCTTTLNVTTTNIATVSGIDPLNNTIQDTDTATVNVVSSGISKTIVANGTSETFTTGNNVAIGEIVTYEVSMDLPAGLAFNNVVVTDRMDKGLAFVDCLFVSVAGTDVTSTVCPSISVSAITDPGDSAANPANPARQVQFTIGDISASAADSTLIIRYRAIVLDVIENQETDSLNNSAAFTWTGGSLSSSAPNVTIVEPDLSIDKSATPTTVTAGTSVQFTLVISHTTPSSADAFDVVVADILPAGLEYIACTPITYSGLVPTTQPDPCNIPGGDTLAFIWDSFPLGQSATIVFFARFDGTQSNVINSASVAWTSLPIDPGLGGDPVVLSPHNDTSTERWYDPNDPINVYQVLDSVGINPPADESTETEVELPGRLPATGFAPNVITTLPEQPAEKSYVATNVWLELPSLGVNIPIVGVPLIEDDWNVSWLGNQAGWLDGTAFPSWEGNSALTGHVTLSDGKPGPFTKLGNLKWGDKVIVHAYGYAYVYQVRENKIIAPNNTSVLKHEEDSWLTLITCKNYNQARDTYANRISVRAVLINIEKEPAINDPDRMR